MLTDFDALWERLRGRLEETAKTFAAERRRAPTRVDRFLALAPRERSGWQLTPSAAAAMGLELLARARRDLEQGRPWQAIPALRAALQALHGQATRHQAGLCELESEVLAELGEAWRRVAAFEWASRCFRQAADLLRDSPDSTAHARFCARLARLRRDQGRGDEAIALLARATALWAEAGDRANSAEVAAELALAQIELGEIGFEVAPAPRTPRKRRAAAMDDSRPRRRRRR